MRQTLTSLAVMLATVLFVRFLANAVFGRPAMSLKDIAEVVVIALAVTAVTKKLSLQ